MEDLRPELRAFLERRQPGLQAPPSVPPVPQVLAEPVKPAPAPDEPQTLLAGQAVDPGFLDLPIGGDRTIVDPNILSALQALRSGESAGVVTEEPEALTPIAPEPVELRLCSLLLHPCVRQALSQLAHLCL